MLVPRRARVPFRDIPWRWLFGWNWILRLWKINWDGISQLFIGWNLANGNSSSYFYPDPWGFMIQFDEHIFEMGWTHQLVLKGWVKLPSPKLTFSPQKIDAGKMKSPFGMASFMLVSGSVSSSKLSPLPFPALFEPMIFLLKPVKGGRCYWKATWPMKMGRNAKGKDFMTIFTCYCNHVSLFGGVTWRLEAHFCSWLFFVIHVMWAVFFEIKNLWSWKILILNFETRLVSDFKLFLVGGFEDGIRAKILG